MKATMESYQFNMWPSTSYFSSGQLFINRTDIFPDYRLSERGTLYFKHSYRDTYINLNNPDDRILLEVINCRSFEDAKEQLIKHLSRCANPQVPRLEHHDKLYDIAYGTAQEECIRSIAFLRGNVFIRVQYVGLVQNDIRPFLETLCKEAQQD